MTDDAAARLHLPEWPPATGVGLDRSLRCFGRAVSRRRDSDYAWLDESSFCSADRGIRFEKLDFEPSSKQWAKWCRCAFRRVFFDGDAVARIEVGLSYGTMVGEDARTHDRDHFSSLGVEADQAIFKRTRGLDPLDILDNGIGLRCYTPQNKATPDPQTKPLIRLGSDLAKLFEYATTASPGEHFDPKADRRLVRPLNPLCLIECTVADLDQLPHHFQKVDLRTHSKAKVRYGRVSRYGGELGVFVVAYDTASFETIRSLRICLTRLHAEREGLRAVLEALQSDVLPFNPGTPQGERVENYLNRATRLLNKDEWMEVERSAIVDALSFYSSSKNLLNNTVLGTKLEGARLSIRRKIQAYEATANATSIVKNYYEVEELNVDNRTINIGDGATISAPVVIADTIQNSFNKIQASHHSDELKDLLSQLLQGVAAISSKLPEADATNLKQDVETLSEEVTKQAPRKKWCDLSIEGIKAAAIAVGEVGGPVLETVKKLLPLLAALAV